MKKKQDGGLKKILISFLFFIFSSKICFSSQILDFETEEFVNQIIQDIIEVNKINKKIKFKINNSDEINAFVDINNIIHINSGLIIYCTDYVALLSVLVPAVAVVLTVLLPIAVVLKLPIDTVAASLSLEPI